MKKLIYKLRIIICTINWFAWGLAITATLNPKYISLATMPTNPFLMLKYFYWDNQIFMWIGLEVVLLSSCATYTLWALIKSTNKENADD